MPPRTLDGKRLVNEEAYRQEAKAAFEAHNQATAGKDVLERCKKLNLFLESEFKGGGKQSKEQLQEILSLLKDKHAARPSFLDNKPLCTAPATKKGSGGGLAGSATRAINRMDADQLLGLLEDETPPRQAALQHARSACIRRMYGLGCMRALDIRPVRHHHHSTLKPQI